MVGLTCWANSFRNTCFKHSHGYKGPGELAYETLRPIHARKRGLLLHRGEVTELSSSRCDLKVAEATGKGFSEHAGTGFLDPLPGCQYKSLCFSWTRVTKSFVFSHPGTDTHHPHLYPGTPGSGVWLGGGGWSLHGFIMKIQHPHRRFLLRSEGSLYMFQSLPHSPPPMTDRRNQGPRPLRLRALQPLKVGPPYSHQGLQPVLPLL